MKITTQRFTLILTIQVILMFFDWGINIYAIPENQSTSIKLAYFAIQDIGIISAIGLLLLSFSSTHAFQGGLVYLLYEKFKVTLLISMIYFLLTTILHIGSLITRFTTSVSNWTTYLFLAVFIGQRLTSVIYYYCYKRASFRISDPRFYMDEIFGKENDAEIEKERINVEFISTTRHH